MSIVSALFIVVMAFITATLSGVLGLAGGLVLMGALAVVLPVSAAFVTHGLLQLVANGWRAILHRKHVRWDIVGWYALASLIAGIVVSLLALAPSKLQDFIRLIRDAFERAAMAGDAPVLLTSPPIRPYVRSIIERFRGQTPVMSQNEVHPRARLRTVGTI